MKRLLPLLFFCLLFYFNGNSQITLSHNIGITPIKTGWTSCADGENWARTFTLSDFGISTNEQLIIRSGQMAISNSYDGARLSISISIIDENFPDSDTQYIGGGSILAPEIGDSPEIVEINFNTPIVVPAYAKRILVVAYQRDDIYNDDYKEVVIAGSEQDNEISWFKGCREVYTYTPTSNLTTPKPNANFFINVTGEKRSIINSDSNVFLSHSVGDNLVETSMPTCTLGAMNWARKFVLADFGVSTNEEFIINAGDIGVSGAGWLANVTFDIYKIDEDFPNSFSESDLIGSSQKKIISAFSGNSIKPRIITNDFENSVIVPADVEMILVGVRRGIEYGDGHLFIAGTQQENDESYYKGPCPFGTGNEYIKMSDINRFGNGINFYITVNGEAKTILPFEITNDNNCINFSNDFSLTNQAEIKSVVWNFNDPSSGVNNTSTSVNVSHQFSISGVYNVTATVLHTDGTSYTIPKEIEIFDAPNIHPIVELKQCDNSDVNGFSFFNLNEVKEEIISNPENYTITFHEEKLLAENNGASITNITNYQNEQVSIDTIWARVENPNGCYKVSEVHLFVSTTQIPVTVLNSFYKCDNGTDTTDGIATFNFSTVTTDIEALFPKNQQLTINYYRNENDALSEENEIKDITNYQNIGYPNQQNIYIRVDSKFDNDCLGLGAHISLNVEKAPIANSVLINPECDNDRDGFYSFDTSNIQTTIIGNQTNIAVSYFDEKGIELSSPLPNPFITSSQTITASVKNTTSQDAAGQCYDETTINFIVNSVPIANSVLPLEECDDDTDGIMAFDTSAIEATILGNQTGLIVTYFDENNEKLQNPLPNPFYTTSQVIKVRLENPIYDVCYEETTVAFIVRERPTFDLIEEDIICMTANPFLQLEIENPNSSTNTYTWMDENNNTISHEETATVSKGGVYKVYATSINGCDSEEQEILIKESSLSTININDIEVKDDSEDNNIQINTSNLGQGDYEFRLLDDSSTIVRDYQDEPYFDNLAGGVYTVEVNDKNGCGAIPFEVSLLQFPLFFTPNNDGVNDFWQIKGISSNFYQHGKVSVFDRYGKLITSFTIDDIGWDGLYNGKQLSPNDFWFQTELLDLKGTTRVKTGNFSLLRQ